MTIFFRIKHKIKTQFNKPPSPKPPASRKETNSVDQTNEKNNSMGQTNEKNNSMGQSDKKQR